MSISSPTSIESFCSAGLSADPTSLSAAGGTGRLTIVLNRECTWAAQPDVGWISLTSESKGQGESTLTYSVATNSALSQRTGRIVVNDQRVEIAQAGVSCTFTLSSSGDSFPSSGGTRTVSVSAPAACSWTASNQSPWITVVSGAATASNGSGTITISVAANVGEARTGTVLIAGHTYKVSQAAGTPPLTPSPTPSPSPSPAPTPPPSPTPAPAPTPPTSPSPAPCTLTVSPLTLSAPSAGSSASVTVTASAASCAWTVASNNGWINVTTPLSGTGTGNVQLSITANTTTSSRSGTVTVAGQTVTVSQEAAPCTYTVSPTTVSIAAAGGAGQAAVTASGSNCTWAASTSAPWIALTTTAGATGSGNLAYSVAANSSTSPRSANISVAGQTVTLTQAGYTPVSISFSGQISGLSGSCPNMSFTVAGRTVTTNSATQFDRQCNKLQNNDGVNITGLVQIDNLVLATLVKGM